MKCNTLGLHPHLILIPRFFLFFLNLFLSVLTIPGAASRWGRSLATQYNALEHKREQYHYTLKGQRPGNEPRLGEPQARRAEPQAERPGPDHPVLATTVQQVMEIVFFINTLLSN